MNPTHRIRPDLSAAQVHRLVLACASVIFVLLAALAHAQTMPTPTTPAFEVATIKPSDPAKCCPRTFSREGRRFATTNTNLKYLIQWAWNLQASQVIPSPAWPDHAWWDEARFDLAGEIEGERTPTDREWKLAVQQLLTDRFHIKLHHETRELPAYALTIAKGGPKLTPSTHDPTSEQRMGFSGGIGETMHGNGVNASIADFLGELQRIVLDRPVVDRTGLTGRYDIEGFAFTREDPASLGITRSPIPPLPTSSPLCSNNSALNSKQSNPPPSTS